MIQDMTKLERKKGRRRRWRVIRRTVARLAFFGFILFGIGTAGVLPEQALEPQLARITGPYQFDFVDWETQTLGEEVSRRFTPPDIPTDPDEQHALVTRYLDYERQIRELRRELDQLYARNEVITAIKPIEAELETAKTAQAELRPLAETILLRQLEIILREEGFVFNGRVFTPPAFRLIEPPTALIISPRDQIVREHFVGLAPGLENRIRAEIETELDERGDVSSYVTNIGGLGSYPTMVVSYHHLPWLTDVIAHEWLHNYLFTFPTNIAWGYATFPRLRTINETAADLVGQEIGREIILRYYPDWADDLPPLDDTGLPTIPEPSEFDLMMRSIRERTDELLAEGKIEEAEAFMEEERLKLVEKGYNLRKLNQAYFAFHGAYALSPASIDPTGQQMRQLRAQSPSLKAFVDRVGWLNSYEDYLAWLEEEGL